ncbi:MAG: zinc finger CCCH domain-containing protein [archaeon]|nr:zinc finger CCCH domain-containing protein [archaeon]
MDEFGSPHLAIIGDRSSRGAAASSEGSAKRPRQPSPSPGPPRQLPVLDKAHMNTARHPKHPAAAKVCRFWLTGAECAQGDACRFLHTKDPLVDPPSFASPRDGSPSSSSPSSSVSSSSTPAQRPVWFFITFFSLFSSL